MLTPLSPLAIAHAFLENEKEGFVLYMCTLCENFEVSLKAKKTEYFARDNFDCLERFFNCVTLRGETIG